MTQLDLIGYIAAVLTTLSFVPQAVLVIRTGNTDGISLTMYTMFVIGIGFWVVFAALIESTPMLIANVLTVLLAGIVWLIKLRAVLKARAS